MMSDQNQDIKYLFEPQTMAVIGAARDPNKIGYKILNNILSGGYRGKVYPINPQGGGDSWFTGLPEYRRSERFG